MPAEQGLTSARERQAAPGPVDLLVEPKGGPIPKWTGGPKRDRRVKATQVESAGAAGGYDAARIAGELASAVTSFVKSWPALAGPLVNGLAADVAALAAGGVGGLTALAAGAGAVAAVGTALGKAMRALSRRAAKRAASEVSALGVTAVPGEADARALQDQADVTAHLIGQLLAGSATRTALLHAGRDADDMAAAVKAGLQEIADLKSGGYVLRNLEAALASAQASGRMATFAEVEDKIQLMSNETNDQATCAACDAENGKVYRSFAAAAAAYGRGGFNGCAGRGNCRGHLQPVVRVR